MGSDAVFARWISCGESSRDALPMGGLWYAGGEGKRTCTSTPPTSVSAGVAGEVDRSVVLLFWSYDVIVHTSFLGRTSGMDAEGVGGMPSTKGDTACRRGEAKETAGEVGMG